MKIQKIGSDIHITEYGSFSLADTLECGQCFRWRRSDDGFSGIAGEMCLEITQSDGRMIFKNCSEKSVREFWIPYFDLERDYDSISKRLIELEPKLAEMAEYARGIRILRQEPWETLCSFIISQNNNIPRIMGIIDRLCGNFGGGEVFPAAEALAALEAEDLAVLRCGFRAKYIIDAARKVHGGIVNLEEARTLPPDDARRLLMRICGVGPKVADCTLLFGLGRLEFFPSDVWIKRVMAEIFPNGSPIADCEYAGIAQQYLFHWRRNMLPKRDF